MGFGPDSESESLNLSAQPSKNSSAPPPAQIAIRAAARRRPAITGFDPFLDMPA
jgi:hypothetical protein